jgi:Holliday junction resolvase RusA-like endonuclease
VDKTSRLVLDALSGILYADDGQVVDLHAFKRYDEPPRISIKIEEVSE